MSSMSLPLERTRGGLSARVPGADGPLAPEAVPLTGVRIDVEAEGVASAVTVSQRYVNRENVPVEAVYSFPLEEQAAVFGFEALVGERRVVGRILDKDEAFDKYDQAMAEGNGAYLLDEDRPDLFTASIGNLLPGQQAVITIKYVAKLERSDDQVRLWIPATVAPRYIPEEQLRRMDPSEFDHLNPPTVPGGVPYGLALTVCFRAASRVTAVDCPSHPARVSMEGRRATVELSGPAVQLDRDVVVAFTLEDAAATSLYAARDDAGDHILMLDVMPPRDERRTPVEAVFLIDRSGSMQGPSIVQAREALLLALSSLREGDLFNVVGFGSRVDALFPRSVPYSDETLAEARTAVARWDADLGGTEIMTPLTQVLGAPAAELPRRLLVLTDGEVANEDACLALAAQHPEAAVFTVGVGYGASDHLVRGLARAGGGQAEFVHPGEHIEQALMRQLARLTTTGLLEPRIDWGGLEPDLIVPAELPSLYPGTPLTVFARVPASAVAAGDARVLAELPPDTEVAVTATGPQGEVRLPAAIVPAGATAPPDSFDQRDAAAGCTTGSDAIPRLFAREAIRDLEEGRAGTPVHGSRQRDRREAGVKDAVIELATRYTLMSSYTSFVAIEEREKEDAAGLPSAELRRIPVALLKGWHGVRTPARAQAAFARRLAPAMLRESSHFDASGRMASTPIGSPFCFSGSFPADFEALLMDSEAFLDGEPCVEDSAPVDAGQTHPSLVHLVSRQCADGSWLRGGQLFAWYGVDDARIDAVADDLGGAAADGDSVIATALAVWLLRRLFPEEQEQWRLAVDKAEAWLSAVVVDGGISAIWAALDRAMAGWAPPNERQY